MLCHEGISLMLNVFRGKAPMPNYRVVAPASGEANEIRVHESVPLSFPNLLCNYAANGAVDYSDPSIRFRRCPERYQVH